MSAPAATVTEHGAGSAQLDSHNQPEVNTADRFDAGKEHSHDVLDGKDQRSIKNALAAAQAQEKDEAAKDSEPAPMPTAIAEAHGNEPSRGAVIDEQLRLEEEAELKAKGKA